MIQLSTPLKGRICHPIAGITSTFRSREKDVNLRKAGLSVSTTFSQLFLTFLTGITVKYLFLSKFVTNLGR